MSGMGLKKGGKDQTFNTGDKVDVVINKVLNNVRVNYFRFIIEIKTKR